jgi:hypothetical protein
MREIEQTKATEDLGLLGWAGGLCWRQMKKNKKRLVIDPTRRVLEEALQTKLRDR